MLTIIAALAKNRALGFHNELLYHLRADLLRFKALTTGHTIIMGRRTFESLPKGALPNRRNIVLTTRSDAVYEGADVYGSMEDALRSCAPTDEVFIIGGASVYAEALPLADRLCLTHIDDIPAEADVFFPEFDESQWQRTFEEHHEPDERNPQVYTFVDYVRKARQ